MNQCVYSHCCISGVLKNRKYSGNKDGYGRRAKTLKTEQRLKGGKGEGGVRE